MLRSLQGGPQVQILSSPHKGVLMVKTAVAVAEPGDEHQRRKELLRQIAYLLKAPLTWIRRRS